MPDISSLVSAEVMSEKIQNVVSAERLMELVEARFVPHYELDGKPLFAIGETKAWLREHYLLKIPANPIPASVSITPIFVRPDAYETPPELLAIRSFLLPLPIQSIGYAKFAGIYFLCCDGKVVYVGQSQEVSRRIKNHCDNKEFDWAFCMRVPKTDLDFVEGEFIRALKPKYNIGQNGALVCPTSKHSSTCGTGIIDMFEGLSDAQRGDDG